MDRLTFQIPQCRHFKLPVIRYWSLGLGILGSGIFLTKESMEKSSGDQLITRDWLAIERTRMANERTFLSYLRSAIVFLASGVTILKIEQLSELEELGWFLVILTPLMLLGGIYRLIKVSRVIRKYY